MGITHGMAYGIFLGKQSTQGLICSLIAFRVIIVSNHLPIRAQKGTEDNSWVLDWDEDALVAQAKVRKCEELFAKKQSYL